MMSYPISADTESVSLSMKGPYGIITFKSIFGHVDFYVELSGVPDYQLLVWFEMITEWTQPKGIPLTRNEKQRIKKSIIEHLEREGISSNIYNQ